MRNKKKVTYSLQTNLDGTIDIVQNTIQGKIVGNTKNQEAAVEIIRMLTEKNKPNEKL